MRKRSNREVKHPDHERQEAWYGRVQPADSAASSASAQQAVQVALDRRDNGGDVPAGDDE